MDRIEPLRMGFGCGSKDFLSVLAYTAATVTQP